MSTYIPMVRSYILTFAYAFNQAEYKSLDEYDTQISPVDGLKV